MNERIKELFELAGGTYESDGTNYITRTDDFNPEYFAEILIKDVICEINNTNINSLGGTTYDLSVAIGTKEKVIKNIKQQYGIRYKFLEEFGIDSELRNSINN